MTVSAGRDVTADQSGILGVNVGISAGRNLTGHIVANRNLNLAGQGGINVLALAGLGVTATGPSITGELVGPTVTVSGAGGGPGPEVISTGGGAGGGSGNAFAGVAAPTAQKTTEDASQTIANNDSAKAADADELKKRAEKPALSKTVGRVTVILPKA